MSLEKLLSNKKLVKYEPTEKQISELLNLIERDINDSKISMLSLDRRFISLFFCRETRASIVPKEVFGEGDTPGVLVIDRYRGYDFLRCKKQYCYEHLKREAEEVQKEFSEVEEVRTFCEPFLLLIREAIRLRTQKISDASYYRRTGEIREDILKMVEAPAQHAGILYLQGIFRDNESSLYRWVEDRDVPADNNFAERTIRLLAIARKVSFGSQSEKGAMTRSVLMTVLHTLDFRGDAASVIFKKALDAIAEDPSRDPYSLLFGGLKHNSIPVNPSVLPQRKRAEKKSSAIRLNPKHRRPEISPSGTSPPI